MRVSSGAYWFTVVVYVVLLLSLQSFMGLGVDRFKALWGETALDRTAATLVVLGAVSVFFLGLGLWSLTTWMERVWLLLALSIYAFGTVTARVPQERLHYLGYGLLAGLFYFGRAPQAYLTIRRGDRASATPSAQVYPCPQQEGDEKCGLRDGAWILPAVATLFAGGSVGLLDEVLQIWWPRRYFDWDDVLINVVSVTLGLLVAIPAYNAMLRRRPGGPSRS
ncbi:MAG: VanZ family protein [Acidobacteriota bacterium]